MLTFRRGRGKTWWAPCTLTWTPHPVHMAERWTNPVTYFQLTSHLVGDDSPTTAHLFPGHSRA